VDESRRLWNFTRRPFPGSVAFVVAKLLARPDEFVGCRQSDFSFFVSGQSSSAEEEFISVDRERIEEPTGGQS
jgi:hypothetical protein